MHRKTMQVFVVRKVLPSAINVKATLESSYRRETIQLIFE
jgi:hypothetical protein